jgi:ELWxxDGT repeat protein
VAGTRRVQDSSVIGSFAPSFLMKFGDGVLFVANGGQLWRSDGTEAGTLLIKDPATAPLGIYWYPMFGNPSYQMAGALGKLFFAADDGTYGNELWVSDGMAAGTQLVKDINPSGSSVPMFLTPLGSALYFMTGDPTSFVLWKTDGTEVGTTVVKSFVESRIPISGGLTKVGGAMYFLARDSSGDKLWTSNGTPGGTVPVASLPAADRYPADLVGVNGRLFFVATDSTHGRELWTSDGTDSGTAMLVDLMPGTHGSGPGWLTDLNGTLMFAASDGVRGRGLWRSDGTPEGTTMVKAVACKYLTVAGDRLFFSGAGGGHARGLWTSDGTTLGTTFLKAMGGSRGPQAITAVGDTVFFSANRTLWTSDGTPGGTVQVKAIDPWYLTAFHDKAFFVAPSSDATHWGLWKSDGTLPGTVLVRNLHDDPDAQGQFPLPCCPATVGNALFVSIADQLWTSDGTHDGTTVLKDVNADSLADIGGTLYFAGTDPALFDPQLWTSDGTPEGTQPAATIDGAGGCCPSYLADLGGQAVFWADNDSTGTEPWVSDGTQEGTAQLKDINPGASSSGGYGYLFLPFLVVGGTAYFSASAPDTGQEIWQTDGTPDGTDMLADINAGPPASQPKALVEVGGTVFFTANDGTHGRELWSFTP